MIAIFNSSVVYKGLGIAVKLEPVAGDNKQITGGDQSPLSVCYSLDQGFTIETSGSGTTSLA